jgi:PE-PPE domain/PE family
MSQVLAVPDLLLATATNVESIGSAINTASASAAGPTTQVLAAAEDEVSAAIAQLFGAYGKDYQAAVAQAAAFQSDFSRALAGAATAYAQAEAANAAGIGNAFNALTGPLQSLVGQTGAGGASAAFAPLISNFPGGTITALIMGGTGNSLPDIGYLNAINTSYIQRLFPGSLFQGMTTPEQFWPVTPQLGNMTFGQSVAAGVNALHDALLNPITGVITQGKTALVFGYSQSATIATNEIRALMASGAIANPDQLAFMLIGNPNNPVGGLLERFPGFYIPFLDVAFNGATPPNSPFATWIYTAQYDGIADAPQYPLNILSDVNALMGYFYVHGSYPMLTPQQIAGAVPLPTSPGYTGNTHYYMLMTQDLPLLQPIRDIPYVGPVIADIFQPDLRVLVDLGYADYGAGANYANIPTPAGLFSIPNPFTVIPDLALGAVQGPYGAAVEIGVEAGMLSPDLFPDMYPWVPSINPGLNFSFGQSPTTLLSELSGAVGNVLHLIPPPVIT